MEKHRKHHKVNALPVNSGLSPITVSPITAYYRSNAKTKTEQQIQLDGLLQDWASSSDSLTMPNNKAIT